MLLENNPKIILVTALQILPEVLKAYIYATHGTDFISSILLKLF
nr:MAG TPA: hypothetical protein [Caudoviricetes sp.]